MGKAAGCVAVGHAAEFVAVGYTCASPVLAQVARLVLEMVAGAVSKSKRDIVLYSSGLSIYRMTRPDWPLHHWADSGPGLS